MATEGKKESPALYLSRGEKLESTSIITIGKTPTQNLAKKDAAGGKGSKKGCCTA